MPSASTRPGTSSTPPPTPNSPDRNPAARPTATSRAVAASAVRGHGRRRGGSSIGRHRPSRHQAATMLTADATMMTPKRYDRIAVDQHRPPDAAVAQVRVRHLVGHSDGEGDIGEVAVVGAILRRRPAEVDRPGRAPVVVLGVPQDEHGVEHGPRHGDREDGHGHEHRPVRSGLEPGEVQREHHRRQAGRRRGEEQQPGGVPADVVAGGVLLCARRSRPPEGQPYAAEESERSAVPAGQHGQLPPHERCRGRAGGHAEPARPSRAGAARWRGTRPNGGTRSGRDRPSAEVYRLAAARARMIRLTPGRRGGGGASAAAAGRTGGRRPGRRARPPAPGRPSG